MQNVHQAIEALGDAIGLDQAALDGNGNMTLTVDDAMPVNFARIDDGAFEMWTPLPDLGSSGDTSLLAAALAANHLGEGAGAGRLALTPDRSTFVYCERVAVGPLKEEMLPDILAGFVRHALVWRSPQALATLGRDSGVTRTETSSPSSADDFVIRI